jgi:hypothetical protein
VRSCDAISLRTPSRRSAGGSSVGAEAHIRLEKRAQLHAAAVQAAFDRRWSDADGRGCLFGGQALNVAQHHCRAPFGG